MSEVISKIIKIKSDKMPPRAEFIEKEIEKQGLEPLRWAIVDVFGCEITVCTSGRKNLHKFTY